jgi:hypothetical protein
VYNSHNLLTEDVRRSGYTLLFLPSKEITMTHPIRPTLLITLIVLLLFALYVGHHPPTTAATTVAINNVTLPNTPIAEAADYATLVLGDPWDMNEYSDISKYMNEAGERDVVRNIKVENGVFNGTSAGNVLGDRQQNGWFHVLFPGYETSIHVGKVGSDMPIDSSKYSCIYIAMKTDSPAANQFGPDQYRVFWWGDERMNTQGAPYGFNQAFALYPEFGAAKPTPIWKLYQIDLTKVTLGTTGLTRWQDKATWQGLRIDPTINAGVNYAVDWVRLTGCQPKLVPITFTPNGSITAVWLRPANSNRYIQVATDVNGASGSYQLDIQGIQPGEYKVGFGTQGTSATCCLAESSTNLVINQTPILHFASPTFYTGEDFATVSGNAWDMDSLDDVAKMECFSDHWLDNGTLWFITPPDAQQPPQCIGGPPEFVGDARIFLNMPNGQTLDPKQYRYFSFRLFDDQPWQRIPRGSMIRLIWTIQGDSGRPGFECHLVSHDITFNVGWNTYSIDLWDSFAGSTEDWAGECASLPKNWRDSTPIFKIRFDPNENITAGSFQQAIDWMRITKPNYIKQGQPFPIALNKHFPDQNPTIKLYYTTNASTQPKQNPLITYTPTTPTEPVLDGELVYLPMIENGAPPLEIDGDFTYQWDTKAVPPGEYYICAEATDGLNTGIYCSKAPVIVTP